MKNISTKALMVITLMLASFIAAPVMISANGDDGELDFINAFDANSRKFQWSRNLR